jgi:hypothetical protein
VRTLSPVEYRGQALCPRCGDDGTGTTYYVCAETTPSGERFTHQESCALYTFRDDLCAPCEADLFEAVAGLGESP